MSTSKAIEQAIDALECAITLRNTFGGNIGGGKDIFKEAIAALRSSSEAQPTRIPIELDEEQCDAFARNPGDFNTMVRAVFASGWHSAQQAQPTSGGWSDEEIDRIANMIANPETTLEMRRVTETGPVRMTVSQVANEHVKAALRYARFHAPQGAGKEIREAGNAMRQMIDFCCDMFRKAKLDITTVEAEHLARSGTSWDRALSLLDQQSNSEK